MRTELHFHLIPGVDDGPKTIEESLELAAMAVADGTGTIVTTPHARNIDVLEVPGWVEELRAELARAGVDLEVVEGVELAQDDIADLSAEELEIAAQGPPGRRWVLLEAPLSLGAPELLDAAAELGDRGYGLLIGHPERCPGLMAPGGGLDELLQAGARLQINGSSLTGLHGAQARAWAVELLLARPDSVIASDAHRPTRGPVLTPAVAEAVAAGVPVAVAERMVSGNPRALLEDGLPEASLTASRR